MTDVLFKKIQEILKKENLDYSFFPADKKTPFARVAVYIGEDYKNRPIALEISAIEQEIAHKLLQLEDDHKTYYRIQFQFGFPFSVLPIAMRDTSSLLFFLNQLLELPSFQLDEANSLISYRYVFLATDQMIDQRILLMVLSTAMMYVQLYAPLLEQIALHERTLDAVLKEALEGVKKIQTL